MYLSIHIPKTGGSTFRELLGKIAGENLLQDYNDFPLKSGYTSRRLENLSEDIVMYEKISRLLESGDVYVHGHFLAEKYLHIFPDAKLITWVRHPAQRLISHYYYWLRNPDMSHDSCMAQHENNLSIAEFSSLPPVQNILFKYLHNLDLNKFIFVGVVDKYDESINRFKSIIGFSGQADLAAVRVNPEKKSNDYVVDDDTQKIVISNNMEDMRIYEQAVDLFNRGYIS